MKIEKKLVMLSAIVIAIGIATISPLAYLMDTVNSNTVSAQTAIADSLFNIDIPCAYYNADVAYNVEVNSVIDGSHRVYNYWYRDGAVIAVQPSINYAALNSDTAARIEFFEYTVYTDKLQLQKGYSYLAFNKSAFEEDNTKDSSNFILEYYEENLKQRNGSDSFGGLDVTNPDEPIDVWVAGQGDNHGDASANGGKLDKKYRNILDAIENTQTVYIRLLA